MRKIKKVNGVELDYVSGSFVGYMKITNTNKELEKENIEDAINLLKYTEKKLKGYFSFSTLFNAYQEESGGKLLNNHDKFGHDKIYADSGGLQVLTSGKSITDKVKEKVYTVQAKYSDYAMTFDEMPLMVVPSLGDDSVFGDKGQVYIDEMIEPMAKLSASHIQTQIDIFQKMNASTKILPILHGYDVPSFLKYGETIFNNLKHVGDHIQGVAIASLRGHSDNKVGIMKIFDFVPKIVNSNTIDRKYFQHLHLLGVASPQRIIPLIMMIKKGFLPIKKLSFDSTAITKAYVFGRVYQTVDEYKNPRNFSTELTLKNYKDREYPNIEQFYRNVHNEFKDYENYIFKDWEELAKYSQNNGEKLTPKKQFEKYGIEYEKKYLAQVRYCSFYHAFTYISALEAYIDDELTVSDIFGYNNTIKTIFELFETVNTLEELNDMCEYFYNFAKIGRTNLRINKCKTIKEFEEKYSVSNIDPYNELGIEKDVEIINEELKKPWIKASIKRATKSTGYSHGKEPTNLLF